MECQNINKYFPVHLIVVFKLFICLCCLKYEYHTASCQNIAKHHGVQCIVKIQL